ncbi:calponin homology domain-containing protein [Suillus ampliporus]|nr:calponin homology domain-containing protein [Suillus ampliporus]
MTDNNIVIASAKVDIKIHPELRRLCEEGETIEDLLRLTPDQILLCWFNYDLKAAGRKRSSSPINAPSHLQTKDVKQRAKQVQNTEAIGCRKHLTPSRLVSGNPRLNLAFVANLFDTWPSLALLDEQEAKDYGAVEDFDAEDEREARAFTLWLNSFGVEPASVQVLDKISPGSVVWRRVLRPKGGSQAAPPTMFDEEEQEDIGVTPTKAQLRSKEVENTNYAVEFVHLPRWLSDIAERQEHFIRGLIWQIIRRGLFADKVDPDLYRLCEDGRHHDRCYRIVSPNIMDEFFFLYYTTMAINCGERLLSLEDLAWFSASSIRWWDRGSYSVDILLTFVLCFPAARPRKAWTTPSYTAHYWVLQRLKSNRKRRTRILYIAKKSPRTNFQVAHLKAELVELDELLSPVTLNSSSVSFDGTSCHRQKVTDNKSAPHMD